MNRASLFRSAACRTRSSSRDTRMPALGPERVSLSVFPLVSPLPSTLSAATALFDGFAGSTGLSDFPSSYISGLRLLPSLSGPPPPIVGDGRGWDLPVLAHEGSVHAEVL